MASDNEADATHPDYEDIYAIGEDPYDEPELPVLQQPSQQQPDPRYITMPLPPCYSGVRPAPPSSQPYGTQRRFPVYQTSVVQVAQTTDVRRPSWEQHPDLIWGQPNLPSAENTGSPSTVDSKQIAVIVDPDEAERQKRIEEADELAAKDVVCCCLGCVFGWIVC